MQRKSCPRVGRKVRGNKAIEPWRRNRSMKLEGDVLIQHMRVDADFSPSFKGGVVRKTAAGCVVSVVCEAESPGDNFPLLEWV